MLDPTDYHHGRTKWRCAKLRRISGTTGRDCRNNCRGQGACHAAGAGILHAHVKDEDGKHVLDAGLYRQLMDGLRAAVPDMLIQITTEAVGIYSPQQQYDLVFGLKPDFVSVGFFVK